MADKRGIEIEIMLGGAPDDTLELRGAVGREQLSRLFELDVLFYREGGPFTPDQMDAVLGGRCAVALGPEDGDVFQGILANLTLLDSSTPKSGHYLAKVVPTAWLLTLPRSNRIFPNMTMVTMVETILTDYGLARGKEFDILAQGGVKREYVVQYEESDWDFVQRWLEHEGFFYWFEHDASGDKLVIADANDDATPIKAPTNINYRDRNHLSAGATSSVWEWRETLSRTAARVALVDYNYRTPTVPLAVKEDADTAHGFGSVFSYGENFKDPDEGKSLAKLRAELVHARRRIHTGRTDCSRFRVGHTFELDNHPVEGQDGEYLITAIEHRVGIAPDNPHDNDSHGYTATFTAIPKSVPFRPERKTPWPRIHGVLHAHVDADTSGDYAQLDDQGRYKVKMPFDVSGRKGTKSSHWIRMAEPYSGKAYGHHFPLHKGAEVLVAHIDGNPDRPLIVGTVPNPVTKSPVTSANATQSVIQTASGVRMEIEDLQS